MSKLYEVKLSTIIVVIAESEIEAKAKCLDSALQRDVVRDSPFDTDLIK